MLPSLTFMSHLLLTASYFSIALDKCSSLQLRISVFSSYGEEVEPTQLVPYPALVASPCTAFWGVVWHMQTPIENLQDFRIAIDVHGEAIADLPAGDEQMVLDSKSSKPRGISAGTSISFGKASTSVPSPRMLSLTLAGASSPSASYFLDVDMSVTTFQL